MRSSAHDALFHDHPGVGTFVKHQVQYAKISQESQAVGEYLGVGDGAEMHVAGVIHLGMYGMPGIREMASRGFNIFFREGVFSGYFNGLKEVIEYIRLRSSRKSCFFSRNACISSI
jgi:hypothetical protein